MEPVLATWQGWMVNRCSASGLSSNDPNTQRNCANLMPQSHKVIRLWKAAIGERTHNWSEYWEQVTVACSALNRLSLPSSEGSGNIMQKGWKDNKSWRMEKSSRKQVILNGHDHCNQEHTSSVVTFTRAAQVWSLLTSFHKYWRSSWGQTLPGRAIDI